MSFPQTAGLYQSVFSFSFPSFNHFCKQLNQNLKKRNLATYWEIEAIVQSEMIPPRALRAEAQGFKQLQA